MEDQIQLDRDGHVATVTLNRPDKLNALTMGMYETLGEVMRSVSGDDAVRVVVVKGAGERAFCSGSDIGDFDATRSGSEQAKDYARRTNAGVRAIRDCRHPTVAASASAEGSRLPACATSGSLRTTAGSVSPPTAWG